MTQIARIGRSGDLERGCLEDKLGQDKAQVLQARLLVTRMGEK